MDNKLMESSLNHSPSLLLIYVRYKCHSATVAEVYAII